MKFIFGLVTVFFALGLTVLNIDKTIGSNSELNLNDVKRFNKIKLLAEEGDPVVQNQLGWMYDQGIGTKRRSKNSSLNGIQSQQKKGFEKHKLTLAL